jgi:hypothetical protein
VCLLACFASFFTPKTLFLKPLLPGPFEETILIKVWEKWREKVKQNIEGK